MHVDIFIRIDRHINTLVTHVNLTLLRILYFARYKLMEVHSNLYCPRNHHLGQGKNPEQVQDKLPRKVEDMKTHELRRYSRINPGNRKTTFHERIWRIHHLSNTLSVLRRPAR